MRSKLLEGGYIRVYRVIGDYNRVIKGDTRSYSLNSLKGVI